MHKRNKTTTKFEVFLGCLLLAATLAGCQLLRPNRYAKYTNTFFDTFDTFVTVVAYAKSEQEFDAYFQRIHERFRNFHRLYDIYNAYQGINNIKTINDNAGVKPVKVDKEIIDLIIFAKDWHTKTGGVTNIAMGSVLRIWHEYRERGIEDPESAELPPMDALRKAAEHTDIDKVIVDVEEGTVFLADKEMSLDVGAVAKG
jgi:thiamine biosynthesis lipoprotein